MKKKMICWIKSNSYLIDDISGDNTAKRIKRCVIKGKFKLENYKNCLEETQLENKINHLENNKIYKDNFFRYKRKDEEFLRNKS